MCSSGDWHALHDALDLRQRQARPRADEIEVASESRRIPNRCTLSVTRPCQVPRASRTQVKSSRQVRASMSPLSRFTRGARSAQPRLQCPAGAACRSDCAAVDARGLRTEPGGFLRCYRTVDHEGRTTQGVIGFPAESLGHVRQLYVSSRKAIDARDARYR